MHFLNRIVLPQDQSETPVEIDDVKEVVRSHFSRLDLVSCFSGTVFIMNSLWHIFLVQITREETTFARMGIHLGYAYGDLTFKLETYKGYELTLSEVNDLKGKLKIWWNGKVLSHEVSFRNNMIIAS